MLPQCPVVLAKAFDRRFEFGDSRHELLWISAQKIKPLKRSLAQLLAFERQRAVFALTTACWPFQESKSPLMTLPPVSSRFIGAERLPMVVASKKTISVAAMADWGESLPRHFQVLILKREEL